MQRKKAKLPVQTENQSLLREFVKATLQRALVGGKKKRKLAVKTLAALAIAQDLVRG